MFLAPVVAEILFVFFLNAPLARSYNEYKKNKKDCSGKRVGSSRIDPTFKLLKNYAVFAGSWFLFSSFL